MSKYRSKKVTVDGMTFDSHKEYKRWCELCLLQKAGKITKLERQVKFELIPTQKRTVLTGERYVRNNLARGIVAGMPKTQEVTLEKACVYVADFVYREDGRKVVEDTKGVKTEAYKIKRKLMLWIHGIKIREV